MHGDGAGGEKLRNERLGAVTGCGSDLPGGGRRGEGVGVMAEEVPEIEGVGDWFGDGYGADREGWGSGVN